MFFVHKLNLIIYPQYVISKRTVIVNYFLLLLLVQ